MIKQYVKPCNEQRSNDFCRAGAKKLEPLKLITEAILHHWDTKLFDPSVLNITGNQAIPKPNYAFIY